MTLGQITKFTLKTIGIKAYSWRNMPWGICLERDLQRIFQNRDSVMVFDVGANVGQTAIRLCSIFSHCTVHSFEPILSSFQSLRENTKRFPNVYVHKIALGRSCGSAKMAHSENSEQNKIFIGENDDNLKTEEVEIQTLDAFIKIANVSMIDVLKTDCEGFDLDVLLGAEHMIADRRINAILSEVSLKQGASHTDFFKIHAYLQRWGYYFFAFYDYNGWGPLHSEGQFHNALWLKAPN